MFDRALKLVRQYHRLNQVRMAEKLQISPSYLNEIERGKKTPSLELLNKYAEIAGIPVSSLMFLAEELRDNGHAPVKRFMADKVLRMLEWIADSEENPEARTELHSA